MIIYRTYDSLIGGYWKGKLTGIPVDSMAVVDMVSLLSCFHNIDVPSIDEKYLLKFKLTLLVLYNNR